MASSPASEPPTSKRASPAEPPAPGHDLEASRELLVLSFTALSLFVIGFAVWAVFAWTRYNEYYAQSLEPWHRGTIASVELTLIAEDRAALGCASDVVLDGLHCGYRADKGEFAGEDAQLLRPYNTVDHALLLGAGLWSSLGDQPLPSGRFTAFCDFQMVGPIKSALLRWAREGPFSPLKQSAPAGRLSNCVIPP